MKKQLKPAGKKGFESAGQNEEIIDLENMVEKDHPGSNQSGEDILDLTDEISDKEQESLQAGIIELTEKIPPSTFPENEADDHMENTSGNVIRLSDMASNLSDEQEDVEDLSIDDTDALEEIADEAITDLDDEDSAIENGDDLAKLTQQLESAMTNPYDTETKDTVEKLPKTDLIEMGAYETDDEVDQFDLLPESEPGMSDTIDSIDMGELDSDTTFSNIENDLTQEIADFSNLSEDEDSDENELMDEDVSAAALDLNRAMQADRSNSIAGDGTEETNKEIDEIRTKLDQFFPEDSEDPFAAFGSSAAANQDKREDFQAEEDFNSEELILPTFDENEISDDAPSVSSKTNPFEIRAAPVKPKRDSSPNPFDGSINLYGSDEDTTLKSESAPVKEEAAVSNNELTAAVQHLITTKYGKKIEQMILQAIENAVSREIAKIKRAILDESDRLD